MHKLPEKPDYLRIKARRRLQQIGSVAVRNSVYVLPRNEQTLEDFQWLRREIEKDGGEAIISEVNFVEGISGDEVISLFNAARNQDYSAIGGEIQSAMKSRRGRDEIEKLSRRLERIRAMDYFGAPGRRTTELALAKADAALERKSGGKKMSASSQSRDSYLGRTWVTRKEIHVDRIASAWLIRRFIDPKARFKFVPSKGYAPRKGELRFDMFEAEFTHEGDCCTFEVLLARRGIRDRALHAIAKIIHDIDLKDDKFGLKETAGVAAMIAGLCKAHARDPSRVERGCELMDQLYASFSEEVSPKARG
ncbi:chromate resistance protein [Candidatus Sumerlaeota bacterium]|nr:chromate resistance protein [Candidatus Sumerlaeota bacterium]